MRLITQLHQAAKMLLPSAMLSALANARTWNPEAYICNGPGFGCMSRATSTDFWPLTIHVGPAGQVACVRQYHMQRFGQFYLCEKASVAGVATHCYSDVHVHAFAFRHASQSFPRMLTWVCTKHSQYLGNPAGIILSHPALSPQGTGHVSRHAAAPTPIH